MATGTRVDIDFSQTGIAWIPGQSYTIRLGEGFVIEDGGEQQPSPANTNFFSFTTNATGASILSVSPVTTSILNTLGPVVFNYNRKISINTGQIRLFRTATPDVLIHTFDVTGSEVNLGSNENSIEISIGNYISVPDSQYYFLFDADVVRDADNFASPSVVDANLYRYTSLPPMLLVSNTPTDNAVNVTNTVITLTFGHLIKKGTGTIKIINSATNAVRYSYNVATDPLVQFEDTVVTITATQILEAGVSFHITVDAGAVLGLTGIPYAGITNNSTFNFTTAGIAIPTIFADPSDGGPLVLGWVTASPTPILRASDANQINNALGVQLYEISGSVSTLIHTFYHAKQAGAGKSASTSGLEMTSSGNALTIFTEGYLEQNKTYYILIQAGAYYDLNNNLAIAEITDNTAIRWNTNFGFTGLVDRQYSGNQSNDVFGTVRPKLVDNTQTYSIEFTSNIGTFGVTDGVQSTFTVNGTRENLVASINDIRFFPTYNTTNTGTMTLTLKSGSTVLASQSANLTYSGSTNSIDVVIYDTPGDYTFIASSIQRTYFTQANILLVGPGYGGHGDHTSGLPEVDTTGGGGGGAGGVIELFNQNIVNQTTYNLKVGAGYLSRTFGGSVIILSNNTTGFGSIAHQGEFAATTGNAFATQGGNVGGPQTFLGGPGALGGGAGAGGNGGDSTAASTNGGSAFYSTILGEHVSYGGNGNGGTVRTNAGSGGNGGTGGIIATAGMNGLIYIKFAP